MKKLTINNNTPVQSNFWGVNAVYHGFAGQPDKFGRVYTEEQCDIEANRVGNMRLKVARTKYDWWAWDEETNTWDWDNAKMTAFYGWLKRMKDRNIDVSLNTGWCCPGDILSNSWNGKSPFRVGDDWEASMQSFANWVSESLHQIVEVRGFTNVKYLNLFTEPNYLSGKPLDPNKTPFECWYEAVEVVHNTLVRDGRRNLVKFMGPNGGDAATASMVAWVAKRNPDFLDIYTSHTYLGQDATPYRYYKQGKGAVKAYIAGGRVYRNITLKPNTEYTGIFEMNYQISEGIKVDKLDGNVLFGVFRLIEKHDIYDDNTNLPLDGIAEGSVLKVTPDMINFEDQTFTFKFKTGKDFEGRIGVFHDIKTPGHVTVTQMNVIDSEGNSVVENPLLINDHEGWTDFFAGGYDERYRAWYNVAKKNLNVVPEDKEFCFDEYNLNYDENYTRKSYGAELVTVNMALMNAGVNSTMMWTLFDQLWPDSTGTGKDCWVGGEHRCGCMPTLFQSAVPHYGFYALTLLARYVNGEDRKVYEGTFEKRISTTMVVSPEGDVTIVVANDKEDSDEFEITFDKSLEGLKFNRHYYDPETLVKDEKAEVIGVDKVTEPITTTLADKIAPFGVIVYTTIKD